MKQPADSGEHPSPVDFAILSFVTPLESGCRIVDAQIENREVESPHRPRRRWLKRLGCSLLILALLLVLGYLWDSRKQSDKLQEMLADLDRREPGWRLEDLNAAREPIAENENSARTLIAAADLLPRQWPPKEFFTRFENLPPQTQLSPADLALLRSELFRIQPAVEEARKLADMPRGRHRLEYARNPIATLLPDQSRCREVYNVLYYDCLLLNQIEESEGALRSCRALLNAARSLGDEPIFVSQLIRTSGVFRACHATERTLAQGEPPPDGTASLQKMFEEEDAFPGLLLALRGERACLNQVIECVKRGEVSIDELAQSRSNWAERTVRQLYRMDAGQDHALFLSLMAQRIEDVQHPMHEQAALEKEFDSNVKKLPKNAVLTRLLIPATIKMGESDRRKHAALRCTIAALAIERYRQAKKAWPNDWAHLCPAHLAAVPVDPFDGKPLRYRRVADGFVVYSVGADGVDNGGALNQGFNTAPGTDIGIRLWDAAQRRQAPPDNRKAK